MSDQGDSSFDPRPYIRNIPDYPKPGILFRDIGPLLINQRAFAESVKALAELARPLEPTLLVAAEARGFLLGGALAYELGIGFVPARKPGKLPHETVSAEYVLEYGVDALEMHIDAMTDKDRVLIHDDLLATGGTAGALARLVQKFRSEVVGCVFLVELAGLEGRRHLSGYRVESVLRY